MINILMLMDYVVRDQLIRFTAGNAIREIAAMRRDSFPKPSVNGI
jgi:hypothetical protein